MSGKRALVGADVHDGKMLHPGHAVLIDGTRPVIVPRADLPADCTLHALKGGTLLPGFVDLQVNGGGGVMLGDAPHIDALRMIASAHATLGTCALLPTLITDTPERTAEVIDVVAGADQPGILGLHLEGPHLDPARMGAHDAALIRPMTADDLAALQAAADRLPNLMVTLAPQSVTLEQIRTLARAGIILSLGHSDCDYDTAMRYADAGVACVTHLFNAMSQLGARTPGLVGAALDAPGLSAGLIADGIHVHPATIRAALAAKRGPAEIFLVTDAMACAGTEVGEFTLGGRAILRRDGRLTLADGTLAGADLTMGRALQVMIRDAGDDPARALARATSIPAGLLRDPMGFGGWPQTLDGLIYLDDNFAVTPATAL